MSDLISRKQAIQRIIEEVEASKKNLIHINEIKGADMRKGGAE